jgi:hypothetical protein
MHHNHNLLLSFFFFHGLGPGIDMLPPHPRASTISSSSRLVIEGMFRKSDVVHSSEVVDPILFIFGYYILYSRNL